MKITGISGKELSNYLHMDVSLISRWKTGKRKITNSHYLYLLANFFIHFEEEKYWSILCNLLNLSPAINDTSLVDDLAHWLSQSFIEQDSLHLYALMSDHPNSETYLKSYIGNSGRRQAILEFLSSVANLNGKMLYLISSEDMSWLTDDPIFPKQWALALTNCIDHGYEITIIHTIRRSMEELSTAFLQWMPLYLTSKVHAYYINKSNIQAPAETLFIAENLLLCEGNCFTKEANDRYSALTNDPLTISSRQQDFLYILSKTIQLNHIVTLPQLPEILDLVTRIGNNKEDSLLRADELFFTTMKRDLLEEILIDNNVNKYIQEVCLHFYDQLTFNFNQNVRLFNNKHIYNLNRLKEQSESAHYKANLLSIITGQEIWISRRQYIRHIESTIHRLRTNDHYHIGLYRPDLTPLPIERLNFWVKEGYFLTFWSKQSYKNIQLSKEPTMIETIKQFYNQQWDMLPPIDKSKTHVIEHLEKLIIITRDLLETRPESPSSTTT